MSDPKRSLTNSFAASVVVTPSQANATDVFALVPGDNVVLVRRIKVYVAQTTAGGVNILLVRRSADNTGGTRVAFPSVAAYDSLERAPTTVAYSYSANPTGLGASAGTLANMLVNSASGGVLPVDHLDLSFENVPITLRASEILALNFNGVTPAAGFTADVTFTWDEC